VLLLAAALPGGVQADVPASPAKAEPARPVESGGHDSAATVGPLAIGAEVHDGGGALIGHVTRLTTDKAGRSIAEVRDNEDTYAIPLDDLHSRHGGAVSDVSLEALKHGWKPR
jgi:hypothetical protein